MPDPPDRQPEPVVVDASVLIDLLAGTEQAEVASQRLRARSHAPAHLDAEVLSALGRLHRAGSLSTAEVGAAVERLVALPLTRHLLDGLVRPAWEHRENLRLVDALYVALAESMHLPLLTTDHCLSRAVAIADAIVQ